ncbi:response regulator [Mucilaginibacter sp.]|uniref:response regulator transcription factor n=1 Tax=Mucilaginibacter sp. TaxID=1882438 RepID=UPI003263953F
MMEPVLLIVDDNSEITDFLSGNLRSKYNVLVANNGLEALKLLEKETVHLVVSDIMMPLMDGFELCRFIKSNLHFCHVPVILLTAKNTIESKIDGLELGADAYIEKPFSPKHLQAQIANLLMNRNKLKEFFASSPLAHMKSMAYSRSDEEFLEKLSAVIFANLTDSVLDVEHLANFMNMSRPTLYRKIKGVSNLTPNELINISRLKKAAELLNYGKYRINEISEMVGFTSQHHFARSFLKQFQMSPSEYQSRCYAKS